MLWTVPLPISELRIAVLIDLQPVITTNMNFRQLMTLVYALIIFVKDWSHFLLKHICHILIQLVVPAEVIQWLTEEEIHKRTKIHQTASSDLIRLNFDYRLISIAKISPPNKLHKLLPLNRSEIQLFSAFLDNQSGLSTKRLQQGVIESLFYCVADKRVPYSKLLYDAVRRHQCHAWYHYYQLLPIFLLLDDPKEAYECMCDNIRHFSVTHLTHWDTIYSLLRNGRGKNIENWDLKVLASCIKAYSFFFFSLSVYDNIATQEESQTFEESPEQPIIKEFEEICLKMKGKEENYLSSFRCKIIQVLSKYDLTTVLAILQELHDKFYHTPINKKLKTDMLDGELSPLVLILKFIDDGHIMETMDIDDIEVLFKEPTTLDHSIFRNDKKSQFFESGLIVERGECLIINQVFKDDPQYYREGTEQDEDSLVKTWKMIGCKESVKVVRDLTKKQIVATLNQFRQKLERSRPDFMVIIIMSHGFRDKRTGSDCIMDVNKEGLSVTSIKNKFIDGHLCRSMIGKPKLFFIQACRGKFHQEALSNISPHHLIPAIDFSETDGEEDEYKLLEVDGIKYAHKSWFFVFHSTIKGYVSLRDRTGGTIFIQALCKVLDESWYVNDISSIATEVNKRIMKNYGSAQAPIFENQLGNLVYFEASGQ